jgi:hypothetical protein
VPSISALVDSLSLDLTTNLVAAGIVNPLWDEIVIASATVTTPIVVTLVDPPSINYGIHVVIAGCEGMVEANGTWILTPTAPGANTFTLTTYFDASQNQYTPNLVDSVGVNPYTGGGTVTTALTDGCITLGEEHRSENSSPPRVMFTLPTFQFFGSSTNDRRQGGGRTNTKPGAGQTPEQLYEQTARMVGGKRWKFEVTCWGQADPPEPPALPDPKLDFNAAEYLFDQLANSCFHLMESDYDFQGGRFLNEQTGKTQVASAGRKLLVSMTIDTPIVEMEYALDVVELEQINASIGLQVDPADTPEDAWAGPIT